MGPVDQEMGSFGEAFNIVDFLADKPQYAPVSSIMVTFEFSRECVVVCDHDKVQAGPNSRIRDFIVSAVTIGGCRMHMQVADILTHPRLRAYLALMWPI